MSKVTTIIYLIFLFALLLMYVRLSKYHKEINQILEDIERNTAKLNELCQNQIRVLKNNEIEVKEGRLKWR